MRKFVTTVIFLILTFVILPPRPAYAETSCEGALSTEPALKLIFTTFEPPRDKNGFSLKQIIPNLPDFATFSNYGQYAILRHLVFPSGEHVSVVNVNTGELIGDMTWESQERFYGTLWSAAFDDAHSRLIAWGGNQTADGIDQLITKDFSSGEVTSISLAPVDGSGSASRSARFSTFRSPISMEHPYYLRFHFDRFDLKSCKNEFATEIGNHQNGKTLKLDDVYFDCLSKPVLPFQARHQFAAIPSRNGLNINLLSFEEIEQRMNASDEDLANSKPFAFKTLRHSEVIRRVEPVKHAPLVVTSTQHYIFIWNVHSGELIDKIEVDFTEFLVLDHLRAIAYRTNQGQMALYSYLTHELIGSFEKAPNRSVASMVDEWQDGVAYVTDKEGQVFQLVERFTEGHASYDVASTGIVVGQNELYRTVLKSGENFYLLTASEQARPDTLINKDLLIKVYSWTSHQVVATKIFNADADLVIKMDPLRRRVFFTASKREIGFLNLERLLQERGL